MRPLPLALLVVLAPAMGQDSHVDTLTAQVEEGDFFGDPELYAVTFGAGCSLACGIGWMLGATSELEPRSGFTYGVSNLADQDVTTAWVEGVPGNGEGEAVTALFCYGPEEGTVPFRGLTVMNGYAKSEDAWTGNGRVHLLEMRLNGSTLHFIELSDVRQPQHVSWQEEIPVRNGDLLELVVVSVYPGLSYDDTAITDLIFWGAH
jgi:hypothetical protein